MKEIPCFMVGTWNVFSGLPWGLHLESDIKRLTKMTAQIRSLNLDVLALQEILSSSLVKKLKRELGSEYDFYFSEKGALHAYIVLTLTIILISYLIYKYPHFVIIIPPLWLLIRCCTAYNYYLSDISAGLVFMVRKNKESSSPKVLGYDYRDFKEQKGDVLNLFNKRGFQILNLLIDDTIITLINCHLNHPDCESVHRAVQITELNKLAININNCVLMGDFNTIGPYNELSYISIDFIDTLTDKDITWDVDNPLTKCFLNVNENRRLDYIFIKGLTLKSSGVVFNDNPSSDHYGVYAEIEIKKRDSKIDLKTRLLNSQNVLNEQCLSS